MVLFAIPVAAFGGVDRGSEVEVVAGAHVDPADPIGIQWDFKSGDLEGHGSILMLLYALCVA